MTDQEIETFEQFWDYYVGEHKEKSTRILHFIGTTAAMGCVAAGVLTRRRWLILVALLAGYGPAWFGHFFIEKNKPATFKYPLWSLRADFVMWWKMVKGEMDAEVERVTRSAARTEDDDAPPSGTHVTMSSEAVN
jgi:hypothetical protein